MINRYLSTPLSLADNATGKLRIGGVFNITEINKLAAALPKVLPVYLSVNQDGKAVINALPRG